MSTKILFNMRTIDGLLPHDTKPLPEPMLIHHERCLWDSLDDNFVRNQSVTWVRGVCVEITINPGLHWVKYFLKEHPLDKILLAPGYNVSSQWNNSILLCIQDTFTNVCQLPVCRAWTNAFNIAYEKLNSNDVHHRYHFNRFPAF